MKERKMTEKEIKDFHDMQKAFRMEGIASLNVPLLIEVLKYCRNMIDDIPYALECISSPYMQQQKNPMWFLYDEEIKTLKDVLIYCHNRWPKYREEHIGGMHDD